MFVEIQAVFIIHLAVKLNHSQGVARESGQEETSESPLDRDIAGGHRHLWKTPTAGSEGWWVPAAAPTSKIMKVMIKL